MLRLYITIAFCVWAALADYSSKPEYLMRRDSVNRMKALYDRYLTTDVYNKTERDRIKGQFELLCKLKFEDSDTWIMNQLNASTGSLIESEYRSNQYNIQKTKTFLKDASKTVLTAIQMGFMCNSFAGEKSEAAQRVIFNEEVEKSLIMLEMKTMTYLNWVKNVSDTIYAQASKIRFDYNDATQNFLNSLVILLRDKFTAGQWLVTVFKKSEYNELCFEPTSFYLIQDYLHNRIEWSLMVVMSPEGRSHNEQEAQKALSSITGIGIFDSCKAFAKGMMKQAGYTCGSDQYIFFGAIGNAHFAVSRSDLLSSKRIRTGILNTCRYWIGILA